MSIIKDLKTLTAKDIIIAVIAGGGLLTGGANTYHERGEQLEQEALAQQVISLKIQNCLIINELNRLNDTSLVQCAPN